MSPRCIGIAALSVAALPLLFGCHGDGPRRSRDYRAARPSYTPPPTRAVPARTLTVGGYAGFNYPERRNAPPPAQAIPMVGD